MMLSPKARIDAIPSVLVSADDVSASHGGTVGELDETAIFYMQSRGLDRPAAVRVIVEGFFEPLIAELADEPLQELVRARLAAQAGRRARGHRDAMPPAAEQATQPARPRRSTSARTSRSSRASSRAGRWSTWTRRRPRRSRQVVIDGARRPSARTTTPTSIAASTRSPRRPTRPSRAPAGGSPRSPAREPRDDDLHQERDRGDQPRRLRVGARERGPRRRGADHADGAPRQPRPLAGALQRARRQLRYLEVDEHGTLSLEALDAELARGDVQAGRLRPRLERARHDQPGRGDRRAARAPPARSTLVDGAQAVPQMPVDVGGARRRLLRAGPATRRSGRPGIGVLHGRREMLEQMPPFLTGGDMIASVDFAAARPGTSCRGSSRRAPR